MTLEGAERVSPLHVIVATNEAPPLNQMAFVR
jgi:hypothetical protein